MCTFAKLKTNTLKHFFIQTISLTTFLFVALPSSKAQTTTERLQAYMDLFPQSQLRDVYKYCFQDYFGLEHLMNDSMGAVRYIEYEINNSDTADWQRPLFHYPTLNGNYVRVDVNYARKGIVPMGTMVSAMLQSTRGVEPVNAAQIESWKREWRQLRESLYDVRPLPRNFVAESETIDSLLAEGKYAIHHSALFNKTYHQHYRIIRKDVFEKMILPLIVNGEW